MRRGVVPRREVTPSLSRYNVLLSVPKLAAATLGFPGAGAVAAFP
jgi:hypothetical protein